MVCTQNRRQANVKKGMEVGWGITTKSSHLYENADGASSVHFHNLQDKGRHVHNTPTGNY